MSRLQVLKFFGLVVLLWGQICYCSDTELLEECSDASGYHFRLIHIRNQESLLIATLPFFCFVNITYFENSSLGCLGMTFLTLYFLFTLKSSFDSPKPTRKFNSFYVFFVSMQYSSVCC